jgi:hypothetical protein
MARVVVGNPQFVRPRWAEWLRNALRFAALSERELGMQLARRKDADSGGAYPGLVRRWLEEETTVSPDMAFVVGELFRARIGWCSGLVTLFAAGYFGDYAALLGAVARRKSRDSAVYTLVNAAPLLGSSLPVPTDPRHALLHERSYRRARKESEAAHRGLNYFDAAFDRRDCSRLDPELEVVRTLSTDKRLAGPTVERCVLLLLDDWAHTLWNDHAYSDDGPYYDEINELAVARDEIISQNHREKSSVTIGRIFADVTKDATKKGSALAKP